MVNDGELSVLALHPYLSSERICELNSVQWITYISMSGSPQVLLVDESAKRRKSS